MTTPAANNPPDPATPAKKKRKAPGPLNARLLGQLESDEQIVLRTKDEMTNNPGFVTALEEKRRKGVGTEGH